MKQPLSEPEFTAFPECRGELHSPYLLLKAPKSELKALSEPRFARISGFSGLFNTRCYPVNPLIGGIGVQTLCNSVCYPVNPQIGGIGVQTFKNFTQPEATQ